MTHAFANVATTDHFQVWFDRTNDLAYNISSEVLTANTSGGTVTGKSFVNGTLGANNLVTTVISGGDLSTSNTLIINSAAQFNFGMSVLGTTYLGVNTTTTGTSLQQVDSFPVATYRGGEYIIVVKNTVANAYQISKLLLLQDGGSTYIDEYGIITSNGNLGAFSTSIAGGNAILNFTPIVASATIKGSKILTLV